MTGIASFSGLKSIASLCVLAIGLATVFGHGSAYADEDPFQLESGHWMSFDHYKDSVKRGTIPAPNLPASSLPDATTSITEQSAQMATSPKSAMPTIAAPSRALNLPVMPGLNKGFEVQVTTTEDDAPASAAPVISTDAAQPEESDIHLSDKNWQNPASINRYKKSVQNEEDDTAPLDIRMSYLPDSKITPVPSPDHLSGHHQARIALEKSLITRKLQTKTANEAAACAALDAYKKQQLDAIQSDRQTLKALQDAIASLGLQKQLGFMTGNDSTLNANGQPMQATLDIPASTSVR
jgi:hypothetical protein